MVTYAFVEQDTLFIPCHVKDIAKDDIYYLVEDGQKSGLFQAIEDAMPDHTRAEGWRIEGVPYE